MANAPLPIIALDRLLWSLALGAAYVVLYFAPNAAASHPAVQGVASFVFLPASVRLLGFLLVGYWIMPALFLAAMVCVDLGLDFESRMVVSIFIATGGPLGTACVAKLTGLAPTLSNLSAWRLLALSLGCSLGSSTAYYLSLLMVGAGNYGAKIQAIAFVGDTLGTWLVIYAIKFAAQIGHPLARR